MTARAGWVDKGDDVWSYWPPLGAQATPHAVGQAFRVGGGVWGASSQRIRDLGEFTGPDAMTRAMQAVEQAAKEA